jgi:ubiquinone/menaquinone biosynthesis C-methylase UbiE
MFYKGEKLKGYVGTPSDLHGLGPRVRMELARRLPHEDVNVLDVGTGLGGNAEFLARILSKRSRIWTIDPSREVLAEARKALSAKGLSSRIKFVRATANETGLRTGSFDCVVSVMALHHIEDLGPTMTEMIRVMKSSGKILLADFKPEAADEFRFKTRHAKSDFFTSSHVTDVLRGEGAGVVPRNFDFWYLVEATKPAASRSKADKQGSSDPYLLP